MTGLSQERRETPASATCEHHYVSTHQPDFPEAVYWIGRCSLCDRFDGAELSAQVAAALEAAEERERVALGKVADAAGELAEFKASLAADTVARLWTPIEAAKRRRAALADGTQPQGEQR